MAVPDTNTFSLQDVVDEINPLNNTLSSCFIYASSYGFDSSYEGSKDRLSNFRNYSHESEFQIDYSFSNWATLDCEEDSLEDIHDFGVADLDDTRMEVRLAADAISTEVSRLFLSFDLSALPTNVTVEEARIELRIISESGTDPNVLVYYANYGTIDSFDLNNYSTTQVFGCNQSSYFDGGGHKVVTIDACESGKIFLGDQGGTTLKVAILMQDDYNQTQPANGSDIGYTFWYAGEVVSGDAGAPNIYIKYT